MTRIAVHGATGRLGRLIVAELERAHGALYAGPVGRSGGVPDCDVVIDVSSPDGLAALLPRLDRQPLLVGTTGDLPWPALEAHAERAPVAVVANFSAGVPVLIELVERALRVLPPGWQVEVVEAHHAGKRDAPSGTARRLVRAVAQAGGPTRVPTHSLRVGDTVGEHTVWLVGPGERLELKHVATRREVFAIGAVRWAKELASAAPGLVRA